MIGWRKTMIKAKYDSERDYDEILSILIKKIKSKVSDKDDDFLLLAVGDTGSGKSMLMLHAYNEYAGEDADIKYIGFTREDFAESLNEARKLPKGIRFVGNDEANINKRDALTKWNKDLLDMYYSIRGLNIFHWWSNPSVDMIDKPFLKDRVKGMFLITTKSTDRPRIYYYFEKARLLQIYEKYGNLDIKTIRKVRKKYSLYRGWFKDYKGFLKQPYLDKKNPRMVDKVKDFLLKYGTRRANDGQKVYDKNAVANFLGYTPGTIAQIIKTDLLEEGVDFVRSGMGKKGLITERGLIKIYKHRKENAKTLHGLLDSEFLEWAEKKMLELEM